MSTTDPPTDDPRDEPTADEVYSEHGDAVDQLAERDDEVGAIFRALKHAGGDADA